MSVIWKYWGVLLASFLLLALVPFIVYSLTGNIFLSFISYVIWFLYIVVQSYRGKGVFTRVMLARRTSGNPMAPTYETYGGSGETRAKAAARAIDEMGSDYQKPDIGTLERRRASREKVVERQKVEDQTRYGTDVIVCPQCGTPNPSSKEICVRCATGLRQKEPES